MVNRTDSFDEFLSGELIKNRKLRQEYLLQLIEEEGLGVEDALKQTIRSMGQTEFSKMCDVPASIVNDFVSGKRPPKTETLDRYLRPFGLRTKIVVEKLRAA